MKTLVFITLILISHSSFSKVKALDKKAINDFSTSQSKQVKISLLKKYAQKGMTKKDILKLKEETLGHGPGAVPALIEVMKGKKYPDRNKWVATFLLGKIVGKKSVPFISKFIQHPSWIMRMASLKTMNALKAKNYDGLYAYALKDESMIVRGQALENIRTMNLKNMAPAVWAMLYDKQNYHIPKASKLNKAKRTNIIKKVIRTVGDLKFDKAKMSLLSMIQKKKYADIFDDMDYALSKITGKKSPKGKKGIKKQYWKRLKMKEITI